MTDQPQAARRLKQAEHVLNQYDWQASDSQDQAWIQAAQY
jgi:hypothetical protein